MPVVAIDLDSPRLGSNPEKILLIYVALNRGMSNGELSVCKMDIGVLTLECCEQNIPCMYITACLIRN